MMTFKTYIENFEAQRTMRGPTDSGLPGGSFIHGLKLLAGVVKDPLTAFQAAMREHGEVFVFNAVGSKLVMMLGADASEFVLMDKPKAFSARQGWNGTPVGLYFTNGLMLMDPPDHLKHRRIMQMAFTSKAMARHLEMMSPVLGASITDMRRNRNAQGEVLAFDEIKSMTLKMAANVFMGEQLGAEADRLNSAFLDTVEASGVKNVAPYALIPGTLGWTGFRARRILDTYFYKTIREKRRGDGDDFFSLMCRAETPEGERFTDDEVVDHLVFLMMAAHDTSTIAATNLIYHLGKDLAWQERCRAEALAIDNGHPTMADLDSMAATGLAIKEVLRLMPPLTFHVRTAMEDLEFKGKRIKKGNTVAIVPAVAHRMPEYWSNPDQFDPDRFSEERAEDKRHRYAWTPFGGGAHKCIGLHFGVMEIKTMLFHILRQYDWQIPAGYTVEYDHTSLPKPKDRLPVKFRSRQLSERVVPIEAAARAQA